MNPADPLEQLHPLRDPAMIGWWPPAPGWWLLLALLLAGLTLAVGWLLRRHRSNAYRRQGVSALQAVQQEWELSGNDMQCLSRANALLKAVALRAYPQRDLAGASGETWQQFLNHSVDAAQPFTLAALESQYRAEISDVDIDAHLKLAAHWIRRHRVTS